MPLREELMERGLTEEEAERLLLYASPRAVEFYKDQPDKLKILASMPYLSFMEPETVDEVLSVVKEVTLRNPEEVSKVLLISELSVRKLPKGELLTSIKHLDDLIERHGHEKVLNLLSAGFPLNYPIEQYLEGFKQSGNIYYTPGLVEGRTEWPIDVPDYLLSELGPEVSAWLLGEVVEGDRDRIQQYVEKIIGRKLKEKELRIPIRLVQKDYRHGRSVFFQVDGKSIVFKGVGSRASNIPFYPYLDEIDEERRIWGGMSRDSMETNMYVANLINSRARYLLSKIKEKNLQLYEDLTRGLVDYEPTLTPLGIVSIERAIVKAEDKLVEISLPDFDELVGELETVLKKGSVPEEEIEEIVEIVRREPMRLFVKSGLPESLGVLWLYALRQEDEKTAQMVRQEWERAKEVAKEDKPWLWRAWDTMERWVSKHAERIAEEIREKTGREVDVDEIKYALLAMRREVFVYEVPGSARRIGEVMDGAPWARKDFLDVIKAHGGVENYAKSVAARIGFFLGLVHSYGYATGDERMGSPITKINVTIYGIPVDTDTIYKPSPGGEKEAWDWDLNMADYVLRDFATFLGVDPHMLRSKFEEAYREAKSAGGGIRTHEGT